ncbi:SufB/SufD family protein [Turneriella parva]|uniref:SufBD protein n=1 Tax=Turneriella parva (strain ATCC BAA-1111 / DSM 21527 / NCTC 11395 / H) TaxID=869212 RepID=I4BBY8_TURPD|nr:SufD family Fe-S cluster assembly protein [Turneriella parva]AFM14795.1 SufBD protein [Turneriella parva DSM 21527]
MPAIAAAPVSIKGEEISLNLDTDYILASGRLDYDCSARGAMVFADFSGRSLPQNSEVNVTLQPHSRAQIFLKFNAASGPLRCHLNLREGSEADVFAHTAGSQLQLVFSAELMRNATARFFGLTQTAATEHTEITVDVRHKQGQNLSEQKFYSFAADTSTISFTGKITVDSGAGGAVAHQLHRGTALSPSARIDAKPFLNIRHDDVKCTHGSTVGFIDETARHYLMARGMAQIDAETMLIRSSEQQFYAAVPEGPAQIFFRGEATEA